jgi:hypothetical protein
MKGKVLAFIGQTAALALAVAIAIIVANYAMALINKAKAAKAEAA